MIGRRLAMTLLILCGCASSQRSFSGKIRRNDIVDVMTAAAEWQLGHPSKHAANDSTQAPF